MQIKSKYTIVLQKKIIKSNSTVAMGISQEECLMCMEQYIVSPKNVVQFVSNTFEKTRKRKLY